MHNACRHVPDTTLICVYCLLHVLTMLQDRVTACTRGKKLSQLEALITVIQCILSNPHFQQLHAYLGQVILVLTKLYTLIAVLFNACNQLRLQ
jgi:hypothetical protein